MSVDQEKAKEYLTKKPLTLQNIRMIKKLLRNRTATWLVETKTGKLTNEARKKLIEYLDQEEEKMKK
jgi:hypothetical protein